MPFIDTFLSLKLKLSVISPETCESQYKVVTWLIVSGIILSEVILLLRTYAIWERRRSILVILCISSIITFIPAVIVTELEIRSIQCRLSSYSSAPPNFEALC
ncbi:hypothetical protein BDZ97DRAFT_606223 [Flammula alnicola]|nr:hypothetical protein BDZ97DRAFT_606223 [Flammula alnicola]